MDEGMICLFTTFSLFLTENANLFLRNVIYENPFTFSFHWPWIENAFSDKAKRYSTTHISYIFQYYKPIEHIERLITPIAIIVENTY